MNVEGRLQPFWRRPNEKPERGEMTADTPTYIEESEHGFRYRLLDVSIDDGYDAVAEQLLPSERLYRMMDGVHRCGGKLFPVLMDDKVNFEQSAAEMRKGRWDFKIAAGIHDLNPRE